MADDSSYKLEQQQKSHRRPDNTAKRFSDNPFHIMSTSEQQSHDEAEENDEIPRGKFLVGYKNISEQERVSIIRKIIRVQMMKYALKKFQVTNTRLDIQRIIHSSVPSIDSESREARELIDKYQYEQNLNYLIRLYTLETRLYEALQDDCTSYAIEFYTSLFTLQERVYQGQSFRGITLTAENIRDYQWSIQNERTSLIEIKTFTSTSMSKDEADKHAQKKFADNISVHRVLFILNFPEICNTAINLNELSNKQLPCLSAYPDELEILLLPGTLFTVKSIKKDTHKKDWYTITLENIPVARDILQAAIEEFKQI